MFEAGRSISKEDMLINPGSLAIFQKYSQHFSQVGKHFISDFRDEKKPSSMIRYINGDLLYRDFGDGQSYRAIDFVAKKYNLSFSDTIKKIISDFSLQGNIIHPKKNEKSIKYKEKSDKIILIKSRNWLNKDKSFWYDEYAIKRSTLDLFNVKPLDKYWIDDESYVADKLSYSYDFYWHNNIFRRKIYNPKNEYFKWFSNGGYAVQGEGVLPKSGELLVITKSLKDVMVMYEMRITAISPPSESTFFNDDYFYKQKSRFKRIVLFLDNDATGVKKSIEWSEKWQIPYSIIPYSYISCKDISDVVKNYGYDIAYKLLNDLIY